MKIACVDQEVRKILETNYYKIPRFQRPYSWDRDNIHDFWTDIHNHKPSEFFIGSMVVYVKGNYRHIVDGQQRLTTITILLAALRDKFNSTHLESQAKGLQKLIERTNLDNDNEFVIQTSSSYPFFQQQIQNFGHQKNNTPPGEEEILLKDAYDQLKQLIDFLVDKETTQAKKKKALESIRDKLLSLKAIYVEVDNEDDAYVIFETLNTRGKDLTSADLLKNHLAKQLRQSNAKNDTIAIEWKKIRDNIDSIEISDIKLDNFVYHFWLATKEFTTEKEIYKRAKIAIPDKASANIFIEKLQDASETYKHIFMPSTRAWKMEELKIRRSLESLLTFRVRQPVPMILAIMQAYKLKQLTKKETERALSAIEFFHYSFTALTSQRSSGGISHMYALHARELTQSKDNAQRTVAINNLIAKLKARLPKQTEFVAGFKKLKYSDEFPKDKRVIQYTLRTLYEAEAPSVAIDPQQMTIEHIEPQSSTAMSHEKVAEIGNLWLLSANVNNKLGNKPVAEKIPIYKKSKLQSDSTLNQATSWDESTVASRTELLSTKMWNTVSKL
ncbi:MAG: DUF262 domain-containing protein [Burkholderiaceae bacterium]